MNFLTAALAFLILYSPLILVFFGMLGFVILISTLSTASERRLNQKIKRAQKRQHAHMMPCQHHEQKRASSSR